MLPLSQNCELDICFSIYEWLNNEEFLLVVWDLEHPENQAAVITSQSILHQLGRQ